MHINDEVVITWGGILPTKKKVGGLIWSGELSGEDFGVIGIRAK